MRALCHNFLEIPCVDGSETFGGCLVGSLGGGTYVEVGKNLVVESREVSGSNLLDSGGCFCG